MTGVGWIGAMTTVIGGGLAAGGTALGLYQRRIEKQAQQVPATVVDVVERRRVNDKRVMYAPIFEFTAVNGTRVRKESTTASYPATHAVGDTVMVWHDPADPQRSDIVGEAAAVGPLFAVMGLIFLAVGVAVLLWA